jgi:acetylornithine deacetylase/succinyl-diaminopimelate desuccinylase-like protein
MDPLRILEDLISIDTSVPPGRNYAKATSFLEPLFQQAGFKTEVIVIPPEHAEGRQGRVSLVAHRRTPDKPRLIFYGHVDVVPAEGWDAFHPRHEGGRIYGRGAADTKGSIASLLAALYRLKAAPLAYDVSALITVDEELGQGSQLRYLSQFIQPTNAPVFDLDSSFGFVSIASLAAIQMEITVSGKSVHSGLAHLGENAVENAARLMQALLDLKRKVLQRRSRIPAHPTTGLSFMEPRLNINMVRGGLKANIVPDECIITVDRRLIPEEDVLSARREIDETLASVAGVKWAITSETIIPASPPCLGTGADKLAAVIEQITGATGKFGEMGSGDLPYIVCKEWGGESFGCGVIRPECSIHGKDEFVYANDVLDLSRIIELFLTL